MNTPRIIVPVSRRTALSTFGAGGLGLALGARGQTALAQLSTPVSHAGHPNVGVWMVDSPIGRAIAVYPSVARYLTSARPTHA